ncbi:hypothetical protein [Sphingobacterium sp.]|uniref:hypothetical protein n=1 Tax=Sphingobacterium sp. TaxID=341027 RepID=UPI0028973D83|nr:hypothetical protein [Sphingobacterium sp.]
MSKFKVSKAHLSWLYLMDLCLLFAFGWTWYLNNQPQLWLGVLSGLFSTLVVVFQGIHIPSLYLYMIKDNSLRSKGEELEKNYQFIKGLY